jgi:two-component system cell cycle sensor histidine kinase/response regulator CckA
MSVAKILIVEDEWLVAQGISENLQDLGYEVAGMASSGEEALRLAAESQPDLVVMDILLQGDMDGIDAAEHLRRRFHLPVVFLTAYADPQTLARAKVAEPYGYILKPFEVRELHSAMEIALYKSGAEKRLQHLTAVLRAIRNVNQLIVQEKDRGRLIQRACQLLTEGRSYFNAWIALAGEGEKVAAFAIAGEESDASPLCQLLQKGEMPLCGCWAQKQKDLVVIEELSPQCQCFLWENYQDRGELVTPLTHQNHGYGVLGVLLPGALARDKEELSLFQELAADLSLALYKLDLEDREQQAQEALRASEEKFRLLVENANQIILVAQGDRIRFANPAALENSGYSLEELTSRPFLEFLHPDDRDLVMKTQTDRIQGREVPNVFFCRYFSKNGALRWAEIRASKITWEGEPATLDCINDITEKREMVEALRQSEEKFRMFFEKAPIGYQSLNEQGLILEVNPTWLEILGYNREEVVGHWFGDFLTPEYRQLFPERFARFKTLREVNEVEFDLVKKDGRVITLSFVGRIALNDEGNFKQTHCVFTDITERQRAEEALRESEERYRTVADFTYDMEYWLGPDMRLIYMSPSCERLTGYTREEFFRATDLLEKIVHPQDQDQFSKHGDEARACQHHLDVDFRLLHRDGREVWVSHACQGVYGLDGQYLGRRVSNRDITERKHAEVALRQANETLRATLDAAPVAIFDLDTEGRVKDIWNPAAEQMLGWRRDEVLGHFLPTMPEDRKEDFARFRGWVRSGKPIIGKDVVRRRKDGSLIEYSIFAAPKYDDGGQVSGNIAVLMDITARKWAEKISQARLRLLEFANTHSLDELLTAALDEIEALTGSSIGFYHFLECDQKTLSLQNWSTNTLKNMCTAAGKGSHYDLARAGVWVDCIHERRPVIHNDYASLPHRKGMPEGHAPVVREVMVPIFRGTQIKAIIGVGNKATNYDGSDIEIVSQLGDISWDIVEAKRAEEALRESEERFRLLVENAPDAIFIQTEKRFAYLNKEALRLFGAATAEQLLGRPVIERFHPDFHAIIQDRIRLVNEERMAVPRMEQQYLKMDGTPIDVEVSTVPFRYQRQNGGLVFVRDITDRKQAEEAVQAGMRLNQLLLDGLPCSAKLLRPHTWEIVAANEVAVQLGAVPGASCFTTFGQGQEPCPYCLAPKAWETGQTQHLEIESVGQVWDVYWVPIKEDLCLNYAFDITARKEAERTQKMLEAQLFQAQKMEALGTLAGGIAHDFNNILGAMLGFGELAYLGLPQDSDEAAYLENLLKAGDRARSLVKQILSFSRKEKAALQPLFLTPIIKETLKFLRASLPTTIEIKTYLLAGKTMVVADPTQINQILLNLTTNAAHAMEEKGGILEIGLKVVQLSPEETSLYEGIAPGPYLELRVSDTGQGLEPGIQERIFEPFFTTKEPWKGTGMGLSVVYGIVKSLEGTIKVSSQPGQGTTFQVLFPVVEVKIPEAEPEVRPPLSRGEGHILFVDDDQDFFPAGQRMLTELGYEVSAFDSSLEALKEFQAQPQQFDLIICDQTMPGLTGLELAAAFSRLRPDLPIILCTGFSETVTPEKARAAGVREVVTKPFDLRQIGESIKKVLKKNITIVE